MSAKSDYLENAILNHLRGGTALAQPSGLYAALYTAAPSDAGGGTEVSGNGYSRQAIAFASGAAGGSISSTANVVFSASGGNWGTVTHFGVFDAATGGNLLYHGALSSSKTINNTDTFTLAAGQITLTEA